MSYPRDDMFRLPPVERQLLSLRLPVGSLFVDTLAEDVSIGRPITIAQFSDAVEQVLWEGDIGRLVLKPLGMTDYGSPSRRVET